MSVGVKSVGEPGRYLDRAPRVLYPDTYSPVSALRLDTSSSLAKFQGVEVRSGNRGYEYRRQLTCPQVQSGGQTVPPMWTKEVDAQEGMSRARTADRHAACCNDVQLIEEMEQCSIFRPSFWKRTSSTESSRVSTRLASTVHRWQYLRLVLLVSTPDEPTWPHGPYIRL